jgi:hypothetical protein
MVSWWKDTLSWCWSDRGVKVVSVAERSPLRDKAPACGLEGRLANRLHRSGFPLRQPTIVYTPKSRRGLGVCNNPLTHPYIEG